jgi:hypothetical protein
VCVANLSADSVQYQLTNLGGNSYQYQYFVTGNFSVPNVVVDLQFDTSYSSVTNVSVLSSDWSSFVLNPVPGGPEDYIAHALVANPALNGIFAVTFTYNAQNGDPALPGSQTFMFDQFDNNGNFVSQLSSGLTTQQNVTSPVVPEPSSLGLSGMMLAGIAYVAARRKSRLAKAAE